MQGNSVTMEIAALVSGGVDSSVTIPLLKEQGFEPVIFYIKIAMEDVPGYTDCPSEEDIEITSYIADKYGCHFITVDLQKEYWESVVAYTIDAVKKGLTPNPDVMCNRLIKFGAFEERFGNQFERISTGHYARIIEKNKVHHLGLAADPVKDQTYFLAHVSPKQLQKLMFPLGSLTKPEVRSIAEKMRLPSAHRPDSQGICFLGKINYNEFIKRYTGELPGKIVEIETGRILGKHKGFWFHTIGQRKGLGLSGGPWYVVKKDVAENVIYVSNAAYPDSLASHEVPLVNINLLNSNYQLTEAMPVRFKIRHQPEFNIGKLRLEGERLVIVSDKLLSGIAPGQFGVLYHIEEPICLGSGVIAD